MLLSKIVRLVNAKSFGETTWTYDDIYPYFLEAVNDVNATIDKHRQIPNPPDILESDMEYPNAKYDFISDMHISNFIVTYIVVAMDNASLSGTSRTQNYAMQLRQYKQNLIADLYRWMPIKNVTNPTFDLEGGQYPPKSLPEVGKVEYVGPQLSSNTDIAGNYQTLPIDGVICENPYGKMYPENPRQKILQGTYNYTYIFVPNVYYQQYYYSVKVKVPITGMDIPYVSPTPITDTIRDAKEFSNINLMAIAMWDRLMSVDSTPLEHAPSYIAASYFDENGKRHSVLVSPTTGGLVYTDETSLDLFIIIKELVEGSETEYHLVIKKIDYLADMKNQIKELENALAYNNIGLLWVSEFNPETGNITYLLNPNMQYEIDDTGLKPVEQGGRDDGTIDWYVRPRNELVKEDDNNE